MAFPINQWFKINQNDETGFNDAQIRNKGFMMTGKSQITLPTTGNPSECSNRVSF